MLVSRPPASGSESDPQGATDTNSQQSVLFDRPILATAHDGLKQQSVRHGMLLVEPLPPVASSGETTYGNTVLDESDNEQTWQQRKGLFRRGPLGRHRHGEPACPRLCEGMARLRCKVCHDYRNFYCWSTGRDILLGIAGGSLLANTSMDQDFRDWVQDDIRSDDTDNFAAFWKTFGEGNIFLPAFAGLGVAGWLLEDFPVCDMAGNYGGRTTRAYLVGAPPMLFLQAALGGSRPGETNHESAWRPFEDNNGVSGHAFVGSVPFITAGNMCENPGLAGCFYFMSTLPAWSRINDDSHYLSQAILGWWIGYLACRSVDQTEMCCRDRRFSITPLCGTNTAGLTAMYEF